MKKETEDKVSSIDSKKLISVSKTAEELLNLNKK